MEIGSQKEPSPTCPPALMPHPDACTLASSSCVPSSSLRFVTWFFFYWSDPNSCLASHIFPSPSPSPTPSLPLPSTYFLQHISYEAAFAPTNHLPPNSTICDRRVGSAVFLFFFGLVLVASFYSVQSAKHPCQPHTYTLSLATTRLTYSAS